MLPTFKFLFYLFIVVNFERKAAAQNKTAFAFKGNRRWWPPTTMQNLFFFFPFFWIFRMDHWEKKKINKKKGQEFQEPGLLIQFLWPQIIQSLISLCFKFPYPFRTWNGLAVTYKSQLHTKLPSQGWCVCDHRKGKKKKRSQSCKLLEKTTVSVRDLAS